MTDISQGPSGARTLLPSPRTMNGMSNSRIGSKRAKSAFSLRGRASSRTGPPTRKVVCRASGSSSRNSTSGTDARAELMFILLTRASLLEAFEKRFANLQDVAGPKRHNHVSRLHNREQFIVHLFQGRAKMQVVVPVRRYFFDERTPRDAGYGFFAGRVNLGYEQ